MEEAHTTAENCNVYWHSSAWYYSTGSYVISRERERDRNKEKLRERERKRVCQQFGCGNIIVFFSIVFHVEHAEVPVNSQTQFKQAFDADYFILLSNIRITFV